MSTVHVAACVAAIVAGFGVLIADKGTARHRMLGWMYGVFLHRADRDRRSSVLSIPALHSAAAGDRVCRAAARRRGRLDRALEA
jgi:hypothetical protein